MVDHDRRQPPELAPVDLDLSGRGRRSARSGPGTAVESRRGPGRARSARSGAAASGQGAQRSVPGRRRARIAAVRRSPPGCYRHGRTPGAPPTREQCAAHPMRAALSRSAVDGSHKRRGRDSFPPCIPGTQTQVVMRPWGRTARSQTRCASHGPPSVRIPPLRQTIRAGSVQFARA
jgi:hypothetical protein